MNQDSFYARRLSVIMALYALKSEVTVLRQKSIEYTKSPLQCERNIGRYIYLSKIMALDKYLDKMVLQVRSYHPDIDAPLEV